MIKKWSVLLPLIFGCFLIGCAAKDTNNSQVDYDQTKKMIVDILKTDDGKKAIQEIMGDEKLKQELVLEQPIVTETIETTLVSEKGQKFWKKSFDDPKFAESFAKSMKDEHEKLLKNLMNDPEYRGKIIEILKDPEIEKGVADLLKSKDYRNHLQKIVLDTFENPLLQVKIQDILLKAAEDMKTKPDDQDKKDKQSGDSGGMDEEGASKGQG